MTPKILFSATPENWAAYETPLRQALTRALSQTGLGFDLSDAHAPQAVDDQDVDYIVYSPKGPVQDFAAFPRLKAVFSLWAGVERIVGNPSLTVPLTRMVDDGLERGMVEWVTGHTLRYHLGMDAHINGKPGVWVPVTPPLARNRAVTVLGLGELGRACAQSLRALGFDVAGWSRTQKTGLDWPCFHGADGLRAALARSEILILLLPNTPETENTLNAETLACLPRGAFLINPGRGTLIDDTALLAALDDGQIAHATLDVFRVEPLPADHPYWHHPNVTVTPHIAAETRAETASAVVAENVRRSEAGAPLLHLVDQALGY